MHPSQFGMFPASDRSSSGAPCVEILEHGLGELFVNPVGLRTPSFDQAWRVGLSSFLWIL
jgi:hypothetical protein